MIRVLSLTFFALCLLVVRADEDVVVGTKDNFDEIIGKEELTLVKFFAPWCGHCKKMAGDFKEAATELKGKAVLVDLDATVEKEIAAKYEVKGFPTLKLFSNGEVVSDYKGGRTKDALVQYIERALHPSVTVCNDKDALAAFIKENTEKSILIGAALDKLASNYMKASMSLRDVMPDSIAFASVSDLALLSDYKDKVKVTADSVILVRKDGATSYTGEGSELESWIKMGALPLFAELSRDNAQLYTELEKPIFILFQDPAKKDDKINEVVSEIAEKHRGTLACTWINIVELKSFAEHIGVADKDPAMAIYDFKGDIKYLFTDDYSSKALGKWVQAFVDGKVEPTTKSEEVPEKNDEPVKIVVGDSWADIVEDESKDVLVEQYAPWCGHCKKLAPILDELAADLKGVETLVIAKMDATKNDAPKGYKAQGYPTLHFCAAGAKKECKPYDGGRSKEDFVKYFKENATHNDGIELPEKEEAADEEAEKAEAEKEEL